MSVTSISHGVLLSYANIGVLLAGASGIGKSDSALELIQQGAKLICDDAPSFNIQNDQIIGSCQNQYTGVMHIRGLGFIHIPSIFGQHSIQVQSKLNLIIELCPKSETPSQSIAQMPMVEYTHFNFHHISIPILTLEKSADRPMGLLLSTAIKQFKLRMANNDPCKKLIQRES